MNLHVLRWSLLMISHTMISIYCNQSQIMAIADPSQKLHSNAKMLLCSKSQMAFSKVSLQRWPLLLIHL